MCKDDGENMKYLKISGWDTGRARSWEDRNKLKSGGKNDEFQLGVKQQGKAFSCGFHCDGQIIMLVSILHNSIHTKTNSNVRSIKCSSGRPALMVAC